MYDNIVLICLFIRKSGTGRGIGALVRGTTFDVWHAAPLGGQASLVSIHPLNLSHVAPSAMPRQTASAGGPNHVRGWC